MVRASFCAGLESGLGFLPLSCLILLSLLLPAAGQNAPQIVAEPQDQYACVGNEVTFSVRATGDQPLGFCWFSNGVPVSDGVSSTPSNSLLTVSNVQNPNNGDFFYVDVTNQFGLTNSTTAYLFVSDPPQIIQGPSDTSAPLGGMITFNIQAGPAPLAYSWWFQGMPLTNSSRVFGANSPSLAILNAQPSDAGYYRAEVSNSCVLLDSLPARCFVGNPPVITNQPLNLVVPFQSSVQFFVGAFGSPLFYQWYRNDVRIPGANSAVLSLTGVQRAQVGIYHATVFNGFGVAVSGRAHLQIELTYEGAIIPRQEATDYLVSLTNALRTFSPPPTVIYHGVPLLFSTYDATAESWETGRCGVPPSHSMWLLYYSPSEQSTKVSTEGSSFPTVAAVYTWNGNPTNYPVQIACDVHSGYDGRSSLLSFPAHARTDYYIAVDGVGGATGTARVQAGEIIHNARYLTNGTFRFEMAGPYWFTLALHSATNLLQPSAQWPTLLTVPATNQDYVLRYTNFTPRADEQRFYNTAVNTNSSPP